MITSKRDRLLWPTMVPTPAPTWLAAADRVSTMLVITYLFFQNAILMLKFNGKTEVSKVPKIIHAKLLVAK